MRAPRSDPEGRETIYDVLEKGVGVGRDRLRAEAVTVRKRSLRESHLTVTLCERKNREIRRLFDAIGREVARLKRVSVGGIELGELESGQWREISRSEVRKTFALWSPHPPSRRLSQRDRGCSSRAPARTV